MVAFEKESLMKINHSSRAEIDERHLGETGHKSDETGPPSGDGPENGPTMSAAGAMPSGSEMDNWDTAMARPDATLPGTMPGTKSTPMPGEQDHASRNNV